MSWLRRNLLALVAICLALPAGAHAAASVAKNSVVSKSIKDGAVKARDLAPGSVDGTKLTDAAVSTPKLAAGAVDSSKVKDNALTGADIDESTLVLPGPAGDAVDLVSVRMPASTPAAVVSSHNGLDVSAGCESVDGAISLSISQQDGTGVHDPEGNPDAVEVQGVVPTFSLAGGLQNGRNSGRYYYVRAADGAGVLLQYAYDNDNFNAGSLSNTDCVYSLTITYTR